MKQPPKNTSPALLAHQIRRERDSVREGVNRYREAAQKHRDAKRHDQLVPVDRMMLHWFEPLRTCIEEENKNVREGKLKNEPGIAIWSPIMMMLQPARSAVITMHQTMNACLDEPSGVSLNRLAFAVGRGVIAEIHIDTIHAEHRDVYRMMVDRIGRLTPQYVNTWANKTLDDPIWTRRIAGHVGCRLIAHLLLCASCDGYKHFKPAFIYENRMARCRLGGFIRADHRVFTVIDDGHRLREILRPQATPMVIPPIEWSDKQAGGYLNLNRSLIYKMTRSQRRAVKSANMARTWEGLNAINSADFRVDLQIIQEQEKVWKSGGNQLGIPAAQNYPMPEKLKIGTKKELKLNAYERVEAHRRNRELIGYRKIFHLGQAEAWALSGRDFWQNHRLDFRSRNYPDATYLNHQRGDVVRAKIEIGHKSCEKVSDEGYRWLKIHAANMYGIDKVPFDARVAWTEANWDEIDKCGCRASQTDFWHHADDGDKPWQFLAACRALVRPAICARLPVQMDGTCNALQHLSAMGRDEVGGMKVNLIPCDTPQDLYDEIAGVVTGILRHDAKHSTAWLKFKTKDGKNLKYEVKEIAQRLDGYVTRSVVKGPAMTKFYNVSIVGARQQVFEKLKVPIPDRNMRYRASVYLSRVILDAVARVVPRAIEIMDWLKDAARAIAKSGKLVQWVTPMGFPVVQPYRRVDLIRIETILQSLQISVDTDRLPPVVKRHIDGITANFNHSIDATHLMAVAVMCRRAGIWFAGVHDSFWSHPNHVSRMLRMARNTFTSMHERDVLNELRDQFVKQYPGVAFEPLPQYGSLDLAQIRKSTYLFS